MIKLNSKSLCNTLYKCLIYRLLIILALYSVLRFVFFFLNKQYFAETSLSQLGVLMLAGLQFDISSILYINILFIASQLIPLDIRYHRIYQRVVKYLFVISNAVFLAFNCIDLVYFPFSLRRTTFSSLKQFVNELDNVGLAVQLLSSFWYIFIFFAFLVFVMVIAYGPKFIEKPIHPSKLRHYALGVLILLLGSGITVLGMRSTLDDLPLDLNHASKYVQHPMETSVVLNTSFSLIRAFGKKSEPVFHFYPNTSLYSPIVSPTNKGAISKSPQPTNVMIIILESFGKQHIGFYNEHIGFTPFLDSLAQQSLGYKYSYANGTSSIDATPSILLSIPSMMQNAGYVTSIYANNTVKSLAHILQNKGYETAFFHGCANGSMRFLEFSKLAGFNKYYGKDEFNNNDLYDGHWGIWDQPFMQFTAQKINKLTPPFLSVLFTVTSHHPFIIPEQYQSMYKGGTLPIQKTIQYSDAALRSFFDTISKMPWYQNTLFVITADHTNGVIDERYATNVGLYEVPILFFSPSHNLAAQKDTTRMVQHADIMPSILDYIGHTEPYIAFGNSIFRDTNFTVNYIAGSYQIIKDQYVLLTNLQDKQSLFNLKTDSLLKTNLLLLEPERASSMDSLLKTFIQEYSFRLVNNQTTIN